MMVSAAVRVLRGGLAWLLRDLAEQRSVLTSTRTRLTTVSCDPTSDTTCLSWVQHDVTAHVS
jgi:hypothetical protein